MIDERKAKAITRKFLEQYHSTITIESVSLENGIWRVLACVGLINKQIKEISINYSGKIVGSEDKELTKRIIQ